MRGARSVIAVLIEEMQPPDEHVFEPHRHLPFHRVHDLGPDLRASALDRPAECAIPVREVEHAGRLAAVARHEVARGPLGRPASPGCFDEHREVRRLTARERQPVSGRRGRIGAAVECREPRGDAIHLISARGAEPNEHRRYYADNA